MSTSSHADSVNYMLKNNTQIWLFILLLFVFLPGCSTVVLPEEDAASENALRAENLGLPANELEAYRLMAEAVLKSADSEYPIIACKPGDELFLGERIPVYALRAEEAVVSAASAEYYPVFAGERIAGLIALGRSGGELVGVELMSDYNAALAELCGSELCFLADEEHLFALTGSDLILLDPAPPSQTVEASKKKLLRIAKEQSFEMTLLKGMYSCAVLEEIDKH